MAEDIVQIKIGKYRTGIIGFKQACLDLADHYHTMSDREIKDHLVAVLKKSNYISDNVKMDYEDAFFRAFKASVGEPVQDGGKGGGVEIKILGQGCSRCNQLEQDIMNIVAEMKIAADIEHVSDVMEIAAFGVLGLPGLVINGQVRSAGSIPPKARIIEWIQAALKESGAGS